MHAGRSKYLGRLPSALRTNIFDLQTDECPVCECLKDELDQTGPLTGVSPFYGETVRAQVKRAQLELLERNGCIKGSCIGLVSFSSSMNAYNHDDLCMNSYMNLQKYEYVKVSNASTLWLELT